MLDCNELQKSIDRELAMHPIKDVAAITLCPGSDVVDLDLNVDVRVLDAHGASCEYTILSQIGAARLPLAIPSDERPYADIYICQGPLIIVRQIDASTIVRAVRYWRERKGQ